MKLKTLKDIDWENYTTENGERLDGKFTEIIKAEAIKWVKYYLKEGFEVSAYVWIRSFFNITEEDLK